MRPENRQYFAEVDGLRAIAVLSVLLFHLGFSGLPGGFIGVDIFFVISGFLITKNIVDDVAKGKFTFSRFYYRRFRRLFPALVFTILFTLVLGILLLSPGHLERLSESVLYAVFSISNIYFWNESGYFDVSSSFKPLLHFWSLAVEEQFYLVWPATLVLLLSTRNTGYVVASLLTIGVISLVASQKMLGIDPSAAFYLTPFRIVEFAIGALCVWCLGWRLNNWQREAGLAIGFILIAYAVITFSSHTPFPGLNALLPSLASALVILTCRAQYLGRVLRSRPLVRIGLISYSLYLIHWPLLVYYSYWNSTTITTLEKSVLLGIAIVLAELMYRHIEQRFRFKALPEGNATPFRFVTVLSLGIMLLLIPVLHIKITDGWTWRVSKAGITDGELSAFDCRNNEVTPDYERRCNAGSLLEKTARVLLVGDSHADQLIPAVDYIGKEANLKIDVWTFPGCPPLWGTYKLYGANSARIQEICKALVPRWEEAISSGKYDYIILASRWMSLYEPTEYGDINVQRDYLVDRERPLKDVMASRRLFQERLKLTIEKINDNNAKAIIISQVPLLGKNVQDCNNVPAYLFTDQKIAGRCDSNIDYNEAMGRLSFTNEVIEKFSSEKTLVIRPSDYICDHTEKRCHTVLDQNLLYKDTDHLSKKGSLLLAKSIKNRMIEFMN